jgi:hypothetical protein
MKVKNLNLHIHLKIIIQHNDSDKGEAPGCLHRGGCTMSVLLLLTVHMY